MTEKKHNYFYKIINLVNNKYYYGIRSTDKNPVEDNYMGSGIAIEKAISKYGKENFKKEIIADYPTRKEASDHEEEVVTIDLVNVDECYNLRTGGGNIGLLSEETKQKIKEKRKLQVITPEAMKKSSDKRRGRQASISHRKNISKALKGKYCGEEAFSFGIKRSKETLNKMKSLFKKGNKITPTNPCIIQNIYYSSVVEASKKLGIEHSTIRYRLKNNRQKWENWNYFKLEDYI